MKAGMAISGYKYWLEIPKSRRHPYGWAPWASWRSPAYWWASQGVQWMIPFNSERYGL